MQSEAKDSLGKVYISVQVGCTQQCGRTLDTKP
jgi:hypothetical protein